MTIDFDTLFERLGKGFFVQESVNTARGTTIPPAVLAYQDAFDSSALPLKKAMAPAEAANRSYQSSAAGLMTAFRSSLGATILETVQADVLLDRADLTTALLELIRQMVVGSESVDASTVAASASAVTGNGSGVLVVSAKRADGRFQENALAESMGSASRA